MNIEIGKPTIVFGGLAKIGTNLNDLRLNPDQLNSISKFSADSVGIIGRNFENGDFYLVGCDPYKTGLEEAELMKARVLKNYPEHIERIHTHNGLVDTSLQAENISKELRYDPVVNVIVPLEHRRRAVGQLRANGLEIVTVYTSHEEYILDPEISKNERKIRIDEVKEAYFNVGMYLDIMREFGLNLIGKIDNRGLIIREVSKHFRSS